MLSLLQADLFKVRRSVLIWWSLGIVLCFFAVQVILIAWLQPNQANFSFTNSLLNMKELLGQFVPFFTLLSGAYLGGNEYAHDMWKNLLTRQPGRGSFMVSKVLTFLIIFALGLFIITLFNVGLGLVLQALFHFRGPATSLSLGTVLLSILVTSLNPIVLGFVSMMGAVLGRSIVAGILIGLPWNIFDSAMDGISMPSWLQQGFFTTAYKSLLAHILKTATTFEVWPSLLVVMLYLIVPLAIAIYVFRRRDMAA